METSDELAALTRRVMRISLINAWSVTLIAGSFTALSLLGLSLAGVIVGAAVTAAGPIELHGRKALQTNVTQARGWMVGSQVWLMSCVLGYCGWRLMMLDPADPFAVFGAEAGQLMQMVDIVGISSAELERLFIQAYRITYGLIAGLTVLFQGGLALYYRSRIGRLMDSDKPTDTEPTPPQSDSWLPCRRARNTHPGSCVGTVGGSPRRSKTATHQESLW